MSTIDREEAMDTTFQRVGKIDSPLLVIGLGGTGIGLLREVKNVFARRYILDEASDGTTLNRPARTAYLAIDTDSSEQEGFSTEEFVHLEVPGMGAMLQTRNSLAPYESAWLDPKFNAMRPGPGAGSIRQASRFMLSRCYAKVYQKISNALTSILASDIESEVPGRLEVVICAGVSGGTGSGTFLDVPQIVRFIQKHSPFSPNITGYLVLPDATFAMSPSIGVSQRADFQANAYAALKELDFWQRYESHKTRYAIQYDTTANGTIEWNQPPYDACVLLSATDVQGRLVRNADRELARTVAENLLHYLAQEIVRDDNENGKPQYSYISHENNLVRLLKSQQMTSRTPAHHGYRAIGAFSMAIPKRKMFAYESSLIFTEFIPKIGLDGTLSINTIRIEHNSLPESVNKVLPPMRPELEALTRNMMPSFALTSITDKGAITGLQEGQPPHDRLNEVNWVRTKVHPLANTGAREYLERAWANFVAFVEEVITNPEEGPFSLKAYLAELGESGFMPAMDQQLVKYQSLKARAVSAKNNAYNTCRETLSNFQRPPILSRNRALETYMDALKRYYESCIMDCFFENYLRALSHLIGRIKNFINLALNPLCDDLLHLRRDFTEQGATADDGLDLIKMSTLKGRIDQIFEKNNKDGRITHTYLAAIAAMVTKTTANHDDLAHYVSFDYQESKQAMGHYTLLRETLNEAFKNIFDGSLDALLMQEANNDPEQLKRLLANKVTQIKNAATPLFADRNVLNEDAIEFTYLSIPANSEHLKNYIADNSRDAHLTPKESDITDRIFCLLTWDGLSLSRYNAITECEKAYAARVNVAEVSGGLHLVRTRIADKKLLNISNDWSMLPTPAPYYYFGSEPTNQQLDANFKDTCKLVDEAIACGMMEMDDSLERPNYSVRLFYTDGVSGIPCATENLNSEIDAILNTSLNKATGLAYSDNEKIADLDAFRERATIRLVQAPCEISVMRNFCGLAQTDLLDPFNSVVAADPRSKKIATENFHKLALAFGAAMIAGDPALREKMQLQLPVFQKLAKAKDELAIRGQIWTIRGNYAETFCRLFVNDILFTMGTGYGYKDASGQRQWLYKSDSPLLAEDLRGEMCEVLQGCGYLADRPETDQARAYLEHTLRIAEDTFTDGQQDNTLTFDDYQILIDNAETLLEAVSEGQKMKMSAKTEFNANVGLLDCQLEVLGKMNTYLTKVLRGYRMAQRRL